MAISFQKRILYSVGGTPPFTSGSVTPTAGGDYIGFICLTGDGINENINLTSSAGGTYTRQLNFNDTNNANWAYIDTLSCASGAQTFTVTENNVGFVAIELSFEYTGVNTASNWAVTQNVNPGLGVGAILGASVSVPTGSTLVAACIDAINSETITGVTGTSRDNSVFNPSFRLVDYPGTGAAIQPTFTTSANGTGNFFVFQVVLNIVASPLLLGQICL